MIFSLYNVFIGPRRAAVYDNIPYSAFLAALDNKHITSVSISDGMEIVGEYSSGSRKFRTYGYIDSGLLERMYANGLEIEIVPPAKQRSWYSMLPFWLPFIIMIGIWVFFMNRAQSGGKVGGGALSFGKSRARLLSESAGKVTFDDVAGIDEAKEELQEIVDFLKDTKKYSKLGGCIPKGALLIGPPGCGKTLLARAIAGEAGAPFFSISGSDFVEMFVGVGASRVRDMFDQAKRNAPCLVFVDEIDAVGRHRGAGYGGGNDEREQTLNQILVEMDGFEENEGVIIIAATNRPDVLDSALTRPGRFDRKITVTNPDINGRSQILKVHIRKIKDGPDVDIQVIARGTPGFSGADLANLVNEAALRAARLGKSIVTMEDFEFSKDKVMMGSERRSMVMTDEEKQLTAYHEAGHALVSVEVEGNDPIHKATIIPRGQALGLVMSLPERDLHSRTIKQLRARIAMALAGRKAEEIVFGHDDVTSGASSDIYYVTRIARSMVVSYGMSDKLGMVCYDRNASGNGEWVGSGDLYSPATLDAIDDEVRKIIDEESQRVSLILNKKLDVLHRLSAALLEFETVSGDEIHTILRGEKIVRYSDEEQIVTDAESNGDSGKDDRGDTSGIFRVPKIKRNK